MKGKLIVIEGLDGSGKSTQIECLKSKLNGKNVHQIKLPDYDSESSALVKMYLRGDFGKDPGDVNAYAASAFYAVDRFANYTDMLPPMPIIRRLRLKKAKERSSLNGLRTLNTVLSVCRSPMR